jgi:hypothetical protein
VDRSHRVIQEMAATAGQRLCIPPLWSHLKA